jgi:hypothetical protein
VIHGSDKDLLLALLVFAAAPALLSVPVFLEEAILAGGLGLLSLSGLIGLVLLRRLPVRLGRRLIAFSSATPPAVSLILSLRSLHLRRLGLGLRLGQVLLCCHACTSWCYLLGGRQRIPAEALPPFRVK